MQGSDPYTFPLKQILQMHSEQLQGLDVTFLIKDAQNQVLVLLGHWVQCCRWYTREQTDRWENAGDGWAPKA